MFGVVHTDAGGNLSTSLIVDADVDPVADIQLTKLDTLTANRAVISDSSGFLAVSTTTSTEIGYVSGVTSSIQDQLDSISGSGITALTGDVSATGPGSVTATIQPAVVTGGIGGKLASDTITDLNINSAAAIAYSKLNLTNSIADADINTAAAITLSKLAALTIDRALVSNGSGVISVSLTTSTEIGYVSGVTSPIQAQLNAISGSAITALTGDVVATGPGSVTATIQAAVVTGAKIALNTITDANINTAAAIARSKLAAGTADHVVINDGSGNFSSEATLAVSRGGTNIASYTTGDLIYASSSSVLSKLADVATGNALISGGIGVAPAWGKIGLTTHVSGVLPVANGGTGTGTAFTSGSVVFVDGAGVYAEDNANFFFNDTTNSLALGGTPALTSQFHITATNAANRGLVFKQAVSQSADTLSVIDSGNNKKLFIDAASTLTFGDSASTYTAGVRNIRTAYTATVNSSSAQYLGWEYAPTIIYEQDGATLTQAAFFSNATIKNPTGETRTNGISGDFFCSPTIQFDTTTGNSFTAVTSFYSAPTIGGLNSGTGTVGALANFIGGSTVNAGATASVSATFWATPAAGAGTVTNEYGFYLSDTLTKGTTKIAFYNAGTTESRTGGRWSIGKITSAGAMLDVQTDAAATIGQIIKGSASQSGDHFQILDSSGNNYLSLTTVTGANGYYKIGVTGQTYGDSTALSYFVKNSTTALGLASSISGFSFQGEFNFSGNSTFGLPGVFFQFISNMRFNSGCTLLLGFGVYSHQAAYIADGSTMAGTGAFGAFYDNPTYSIANGGTWGTTSAYMAFDSNFISNTGVTFGTRKGFVFNDGTGAGTIATQVGLDIASLTKGGTANIAIRTGASGVIEIGNKITKYNNIATVSNGVPSELATVDLTTQGAAIAATTIYTPAATGMFRVSFYLQVTRAATTSSTLGAVTITYNDGVGNVAQSVVLQSQNAAGAAVTTATTNTTATNLSGNITINARTGVAIQYAIAYASSGGTSMQYSVSAKVEAL